MPNSKTRAKAGALVLSMAFLLSGIAFMIHPASAESFNNVQVFATSSSTQTYNYQFAAYNLTGSLISSYQTPYPAAAFELPIGGYLFTVSATQYNHFMGYPCPLAEPASSGSTASSGPMMPTNGSGKTTIMPIVCYPPSSEYGYTTSNISGSQTINIQMQNVTTLPTSPVTIKVTYVNGTAAADASVYASVVGEWYYWWWQDNSITMNAQTDSNGIAHLVLPTAPAVVTAWKWVPIYSSQNGTITTTVGGQKVNVTVYWEPTYVGLSGSGLLFPPQTDVSLTLRYQQPDYWVMPAGVMSKGAYVGGTPTATVASQPNGTPSLAPNNSGAQGSNQYYLPARIPAMQQANGVGSPSGAQAGFFNTDFVIGAGIFVGIALAVVFLAKLHTSKPSTLTG